MSLTVYQVKNAIFMIILWPAGRNSDKITVLQTSFL